ncbi:MAG: hypothetical protein ACOX7J_02980 [Bacillota bacterium]|jgi:hypothetical protein
MKITAEEIYRKYERGIDFHNKNRIYSRSRRCVKLYEGEHWYDESTAENKDSLPFYNYTASIVDYKTAMVSKNAVRIVYSPMNSGSERTRFVEICKSLNAYADDRWEHLKMESLCWELVKKACITGDSYIYFANSDLMPQIIDNVNVYLSDEQQTDIQKQKYIIISERRFVSDIKKKAKKDDAEKIVPDEPENQINNDDNEVLSEDGKVTSLLYLCKDENGNVCFFRSTKSVIYEEGVIDGLTLYPLAQFVWKRKYNSARGLGEVWGIRANQIITNKNLYRREQAVKTSAFPKPVYIRDSLSNPESLMQIGSAVELDIDNTVDDIHKVFGYINPAPMSGDAKVLQDEVMEITRELANAGDNATGNIDPEQASGKAISLVVDQNAMLLTEQNVSFNQCAEDIALIWFEMWYAYHKDGFAFQYHDKETDELIEAEINGEDFSNLKVSVRIDVSPTNAWSIYQNDQEVMNMFGNQMISFEEYVELLTDTNPMKGKLEVIIEERKVRQEQQMMQQQMLQEQAMQEQAMAMQQQSLPAMQESNAPEQMQTAANPPVRQESILSDL